MSKYSISTNVLLTLILLVLIVLGTTGCTESLMVKPDAEVRAITPEQAGKWADKNEDQENARLFIVHSDNMKGLIQWLTAIGIKVSWVKSEPKSQK